jgi:hypothetical protein
MAAPVVASVAVLVLTAAAPAPAAQRPKLEDGGSFPLYAAGDVSRLDYEYHAPGLEIKVKDGQTFNEWHSPDCLVLSGWAAAPTEGLAELADRLVVSDGPGILIEGRDVNVLTPRQINGTWVYFLKDLATYVTGVRVEVKDGRSFDETLRDVFGEDTYGVSLQLSRGCRILGETPAGP